MGVCTACFADSTDVEERLNQFDLAVAASSGLKLEVPFMDPRVRLVGGVLHVSI